MSIKLSDYKFGILPKENAKDDEYQQINLNDIPLNTKKINKKNTKTLVWFDNNHSAITLLEATRKSETIHWYKGKLLRIKQVMGSNNYKRDVKILNSIKKSLSNLENS